MNNTLIEKLKANVKQLYKMPKIFIKRGKRKAIYEETIQLIDFLDKQNIELQDTANRLRNQLRKGL